MRTESRDAWDRKYETQGALWAKASEVWFQVGERDRVLDVGCGSGKSSTCMKARVIAADFSMSALRMAAESNPLAEYVCCEATKLPFRDSSFDLIRASFILDHLEYEGRRKLLGEVDRVLDKKGRLAIDCFSRNDGRFVRRDHSVSGEFIDGDGILHHYFDRDELADLLSGFNCVSLSEISWEQGIGSGKSMKRYAFRALFSKLDNRRSHLV